MHMQRSTHHSQRYSTPMTVRLIMNTVMAASSIMRGPQKTNTTAAASPMDRNTVPYTESEILVYVRAFTQSREATN